MQNPASIRLGDDFSQAHEHGRARLYRGDSTGQGSHGAATGARPGPRVNLGKWGILGKIFFQGGFGGIWAHPKGLPRPWNPFPLVGAPGTLVGGPFFHKTTSPMWARAPFWPMWAQAILAHLGPGHLGPSGPGPSRPIWARAILAHLGPAHLGPLLAQMPNLSVVSKVCVSP